MKNTNKSKTIKELAKYFDQELQTTLPVTVLPNGDLVYKFYFVKETANGYWSLFSIKNKELIAQFYLKSCALMAAKAYNNLNMEEFVKIKQLDRRYWSNYSDNLLCKRSIKTAKDFDKYLILLNKLEHSESKSLLYKKEISRMFKWSFV